MNKAELIEHLAKKTGLSKNHVDTVLLATGETVKAVLANRDEVTLPGLGKFSATLRAGRTGRNPQTGKPVQIAAKHVPSFKASSALKEATA